MANYSLFTQFWNTHIVGRNDGVFATIELEQIDTPHMGDSRI
jgi:hypothetical protein